MFEDNLLEVADGPYETIVLATVIVVRALLFQWYSAEAKAGRPHTQVQNLTANMFGSRDSPAFDLHASETNHILPFLSTLLDRFGTRMRNHSTWRRGLNSLLTMQEIYGAHDYKNLPTHELQRLVDSIVVHYRACAKLRIPSKPKHHFMMELVIRSRLNGGLALSATFPDEGLNRIIKSIGQSAHRMNWTQRVLDDFEASQALQPVVQTFRKRPRVV